MNKFLTSLAFILTLASCSNAPEMETGEIRTLQLLKAFDSSSKNTQFIDARNLINREQIDAANIPVLFVELASGQSIAWYLIPVKAWVKHGLAQMEQLLLWIEVS